MTFKFSKKSETVLATVKPKLQQVVRRALEISAVDFAVLEGIRTIETQKKYVAQGVSQTMASKHLTGDAVDLLAYVGARASWEFDMYYKIADAMRQAAQELKVDIRWGGSWTTPNLRTYKGTTQAATEAYVDSRRKAKQKVFLDGPHFELV